MKVVITYEFDDCVKCPYKTWFQEGGSSGYVCCKPPLYLKDIPKKGIRKDCPLLNENHN